MKILIVDDQRLVLLLLEKCLTNLGHEVICSDNVFGAIKMYDHKKPNMVISDINMPILPTENNTLTPIGVNERASGLEIIKYIKQIKKHKTPVLILSGNKDIDVILKGFELGIEDYMKKPMGFREIAARIKRVVNHQVQEN